jgi:hypothetical protein
MGQQPAYSGAPRLMAQICRLMAAGGTLCAGDGNRWKEAHFIGLDSYSSACNQLLE